MIIVLIISLMFNFLLVALAMTDDRALKELDELKLDSSYTIGKKNAELSRLRNALERFKRENSGLRAMVKKSGT